MTDLAWYAIYTKPHSEREAVANFANQSIPTLYPQTRIESKANPENLLDRPLFQRYLFAHLEPWQLSPARYTRGVLRIVGFEDGRPLTIDDWIIEAMRETLDADGFHLLSPKRTPKPGLIIQIGSVVRIWLGAFAGQQGVLRETQGRWANVQIKPSGKTVRVDRLNLRAAIV